MRARTTILWVGIIMLIFGGLGIIEDLSGIVIPLIDPSFSSEMPARFEEWLFKASITGLAVNVIWVIAGIYFLSRKRFALRLMYLALVTSLIYGVLTGLFFPVSDVNLGLGHWISLFFGIFIDLLLLMALVKVTPIYHDPEPVIDPKRNLTAYLTVVASVLLLLQMTLFGLWVIASERTESHREAVELFHTMIPEFLHGPSVVVGFFLGLIAGILSIRNLAGQPGVFKWWNIIILTLSIPLTLLHLWGLM
ncbi:MAG: hypothetical protein LPK28_07810 [Bacteroidota bacterium]|nr:hypothetical protein [Bacteroidota bacterium]